MGHFEREAKLNILIVLGPIIIALVLGMLGVFVLGLIDNARIDECLDRGGSYNYPAELCDFSESHPAPE